MVTLLLGVLWSATRTTVVMGQEANTSTRGLIQGQRPQTADPGLEGCGVSRRMSKDLARWALLKDRPSQRIALIVS